MRRRGDAGTPHLGDLVAALDTHAHGDRGPGAVCVASPISGTVIDDDHQGVEQVVRADDLLASTPRQLHITELLDITPPTYAHVPLVLGPSGDRLAKRDGSVTLDDRVGLGESVATVVGMLAASLGLVAPGTECLAADLIDGFDPSAIRREPWVMRADDLG